MLYICTKFQENISKAFRVIAAKSVGEVMVTDLFTLSDSVSYLFYVLSKYLIGFHSYGPEQ